MKREFSAGGIVFNSQGQVLLINNMALRESKKSYWGFPKGHLEPNESTSQAALREVEEETGIKAAIVDKVGESKFFFTHQGEKIFKVVTMYLMNFISGQITVQQDELLGVEWVEQDQVLSKLSFKNDKQLFIQALEMKNG